VSFQRRATAFDLARRAGARYVGANGASLEEYMASGTYTPTITPDGGGTASLHTDGFGFSRVGNGAGVPMAGDTVTVYGGVDFLGFGAGDRFDLSLPFELADAPFAVSISLENGFSVGCKATPGDTTTLWVFMDSAAAQTVAFITFTYQTANAVDP